MKLEVFYLSIRTRLRILNTDQSFICDLNLSFLSVYVLGGGNQVLFVCFILLTINYVYRFVFKLDQVLFPLCCLC